MHSGTKRPIGRGTSTGSRDLWIVDLSLSSGSQGSKRAYRPSRHWHHQRTAFIANEVNTTHRSVMSGRSRGTAGTALYYSRNFRGFWEPRDEPHRIIAEQPAGKSCPCRQTNFCARQ